MSGGITFGQAVPATRVDGKARTFLLLILLVTIMPNLLYHPDIVRWYDGGSIAIAFFAIWLLANAHVAITGLFWFDPAYRGHIQSKPYYFYVLPVAIVLPCAVAVHMAGAVGLEIFTIFFMAWNLHHFGRQNWGVLCLAAAGTKSGPPARIEYWISEITAVAAILGTVAIMPIVQRNGAGDILRIAGAAAAYTVAGAALVLAARQLIMGQHPLRAMMTAMVGLFFLPVHLVSTMGGSVAVAVAHSYQYVVIMCYLASARDGAGIRHWILPLAGLSIVYIVLFAAFLWTAWGSFTPLATVLILAFAMWHFLIDAELWRLRSPFQRAAVRKRLPFLFG